jgi:hypothetical protein
MITIKVGQEHEFRPNCNLNRTQIFMIIMIFYDNNHFNDQRAINNLT